MNRNVAVAAALGIMTLSLLDTIALLVTNSAQKPINRAFVVQQVKTVTMPIMFAVLLFWRDRK
jgi:hypothetical protein